jgi:muconolactone delta-isomerase
MSEKKTKLNDKFILDATAGFRKIWFNKKHPNCLYVDIRPECEPDEVQDFRKLPYPNQTFKLVIFDPPHLIESWQPNKNNPFTKYYGLLKAEKWQDDLKKGLLECWRVLEDYGVLLFKWSTHDKAIDNVLASLPFNPLIVEETRSNPLSKHPNNKKSRFGANKTLWFCFMKIPKVEKEAK